MTDINPRRGWVRWVDRLQPWIDRLGIVYLLSLILILFFNRFFRDQIPFVNLMMTFGLFLFVPLSLIFLYWLAYRARSAMVVMAIGGGLFFWTHPVIPFQRLTAGPPADSAEVVSMMTFNLGYQTTEASLVVDTLAANPADLVAIQEVTPQMFDDIEMRLGDEYPYRVIAEVGEYAQFGRSTSGLMSKYPIVDHEWLVPESGRPTLHAQVDMDGQPLDLFVVHFRVPDLSVRGLWEGHGNYETELLLTHAADIEGPVILMGDFNMSDQSDAYRLIRKSYGDAFRASGFGLGYSFPTNFGVMGVPIPGPLVRIDYMFFRGPLTPVFSNVTCFEGVSDHCALQTEFLIEG